MRNKKVAKIGSQCVACGTCIRECPFGAIKITNGVKANVNTEICVGCGKCSKICPASVIEIIAREVEYEK